MQDQLVQLIVVAGLALAVAGLLWLMLRLDAPPWAYLILCSLPVILMLLDGGYRTVSYHGLMHTSIVYELNGRGVPPEHPLLAGHRLLYPYGHHLAVAWVVRALPVSPPWVFAATNVLALLLFVVVADRAARHVDRDRTFRVFAVLLMLMGTNLFRRGPLASLLARLDWPIEPRTSPWHKFTTVNSNQLGLLFAAVALLGLVALASGRRRAPALAAVGVGLLGAALLYPMSWLMIGVWTAMACGVLFLSREPDRRAAALELAGVALAVSLAVLPYIRSISRGKAGDSGLLVAPSPEALWRHAAVVLSTLVLPAALAWLRRQELAERLRAMPRVTATLLLCATASVLLFLGSFLSSHVSYKFLAAGMLPLGLLAAIPLWSLYRTRPAAAMAVVALLLLPPATFFYDVAGEGWRSADPVVANGRSLRHADPAKAHLYRWIDRRTSREAMFVDTHLTVPAFGQRPLFVGLDERRERRRLQGRRDGWGITAASVLEEVTGADPRTLEARRRIARALLAPDPGPVPEEVFQELAREAAGRPVYIVARDRSLRTRLAAASHLRPAYRGPAADVYLFRP